MSQPPIRREAFEIISEPRVPAVRLLVGALGRFQTSLIEALAQLWALPFVGVGARVVTAGPLGSAGTFTIKHGLQRVPSGYLVVDVMRAPGATGDIAVYRRQGEALTASDLTLYASSSFERMTLLVWP